MSSENGEGAREVREKPGEYCLMEAKGRVFQEAGSDHWSQKMLSVQEDSIQKYLYSVELLRGEIM